MNPYYYDELPITGADEEMMMSVLLILLGVLAVALLVSVIFWIISSLSLQSIARRRGIRNAWLAWVPIGNQWILGSIADQYQHLIQGKITSRRKILLILSLVSMLIGMCNGVFSAFLSTGVLTEEEAGAVVLLSAIPNILGAGIGIATMVFYHICNYDFYRSCNPRNAVVFLVLGIVLPVCQPFFYFACRKKDLGMVVPRPVTPEPAELPPVSPEF